MARFLQKWGAGVVKAKRVEELRGLLVGWKVRAEGATDFNLSDREKEAMRTASKGVEDAIVALASMRDLNG